jgi:hypothetical protein
MGWLNYFLMLRLQDLYINLDEDLVVGEEEEEGDKLMMTRIVSQKT